jgi:hypothetical protein
MWPFSSRGSRSGTPAPEPKDLPPVAEFERDDAVLKLWLPAVLSDRLNWLSTRLDASRQDILRALLFEHIYGRVAYEALKAEVKRREIRADADQTRWLGENNASADRAITAALHASSAGYAQLSRSRHTMVDLEYLGKSADDFKLHLPARLKRDLASIARKHGLTQSSYARKLLVQMLLGDAVHTDWQKAIGKISAEVERLERDD